MGIGASEGNVSRTASFNDGLGEPTKPLEVKPTTLPSIVSDITTTIGSVSK